MFIPQLVPCFIKIELTNESMTLQFEAFSKNDWLQRVFRKSESVGTENVAKASLRMFELFCESEGLTEPQMIERYQALVKEGDIRSVCLSLDKFIQFLNQDHEDIILNPMTDLTFKRKSAKTIKTYFGFVKSYLRICHAVKISIDDVKDYIQFPRLRKEPRKAIDLKTIKKIITYSSPLRRALYLVLISSGMRIGECLALTKADLHFNENPVRITINAEPTKTKEGRETYISSEAYDELKPFLDVKKDNKRIFTDYDELDKAVIHEEQYFAELRERLNLLEKYPNSNRHVVNIHCFRAYFHTKASQKNGSDYANALDGHGAYLKQYYRQTDEERAKKYKELEPDLLIKSQKLESEITKDKIIEDMQAEMQKLKDKMTRLELLNESR